MKLALLPLALLLLQQGTPPDRGAEVGASPELFRYERPIQLPPGTRGPACAVLDAPVYAHTGGEMSGLRVYRSDAAPKADKRTDVPFALTESGEAGQQDERARVLNLARRGSATAFDLAMPARAYTEVTLDLAAHNFIASARVAGGDHPGHTPNDLGEYALFDLTAQRLSRSTTLPLQEASFPILHVELTLRPSPGSPHAAFAPDIVRGATVPPSRYAQTLFTTVAETSALAPKDRDTTATFRLGAHVPVERVRFVLPPAFDANFSRPVRITARPVSSIDDASTEILTGTIQRVHLPAADLGRPIRQEQLTVEAVLAANLRQDATVTIAVQNGDDAPLPLSAVQLQMRQRKVCFDATPGAAYVLRYGDDAPVRPAVYDYARLFRATATAASATLGAEALNPHFNGTIRRQSYIARHPELLWIALLATIAILGAVAVHSAKVASKR